MGGGGGGGEGEILREINGQDHQTSMARIGVSICSIWSWSLLSSEDIGKQYSIAFVYGINNTSSKIIKIQNNEFFGQTAQVHILFEPMMPPKVI